MYVGARQDAVRGIILFVIFPEAVVGVGVIAAVRVIVGSTAGAIGVVGVNAVVAVAVLPGDGLIAIGVVRQCK
ncbi:MAG: hypothetical protein A2V79_12455 [Betaproteobacteria bacterium RBG_16_56_24]|nr:MAG: hypothetical protein A2V79_12455 [Betaproteobacteria bacterium RBG_16_56_24]